MKITILTSGSKGNSLHVEAGDTCFLVDAGLSCKQLEARMASEGIDPCRLTAILVTHEHTDHISAIPVLSRRYEIPVYLAQRLWNILRSRDLLWYDMIPFEPGQPFTLGAVTVESFRTRHDATDPVGFTFSCDGMKFGMLTDCGATTPEIEAALEGCDGLLLESNHDEGLLKRGPYPPHLKSRIASDRGHLSNRQSAGLLKRLVTPRLQCVALGHLSEENNSPELAYNTSAHTLRHTPGDIALVVAAQRTVTAPLHLTRR